MLDATVCVYISVFVSVSVSVCVSASVSVVSVSISVSVCVCICMCIWFVIGIALILVLHLELTWEHNGLSTPLAWSLRGSEILEPLGYQCPRPIHRSRVAVVVVSGQPTAAKAYLF
ncbi:hypothetical protein N9L68_08840 [bacterium]|nr:hypothetical protein [bacterium]